MTKLMPLPFPEPTTQAIASYDYFEFTSGVGVVDFYGYATSSSSATTHHISNVANRTDPLESSRDSATGTTTLNFDANPFQQSVTIEGDANVSFSRFVQSAPGGTTITAHIAAHIIHFDGTTETTLGTERTTDITEAADSESTETNSLNITLTRKHFKIGDVLRLRMNLVISANTGGNSISLAHDPYNDDSPNFTAANNTTILKASIPFKSQE